MTIDAAVDAIFGDPILAEDGTWTADGAAPVPLRVVFTERPRGGRLDQVRQVHDGPVARVRTADVSTPGTADSLTVRGRTFRPARWDRSRDGRTWTIDLEEQGA